MTTSSDSKGVSGNTPSQLNTAAGSAGTTQRGVSWKKHSRSITLVVALFVCAMIAFGIKASGVQFAGLLVIGSLVWYVGTKLSDKPQITIKQAVTYTGMALVGGTLLFSPLVQASLGKVNEVQTSLTETISESQVDCPAENHTAEVNGVYTLKQGCGSIRLTGSIPEAVQFQVVEGVGNADFDQNLSVRRPYVNVWYFTALESVPVGTEITFRIVPPEEVMEAAANAETSAQRAIEEAKAASEDTAKLLEP